MPFFISQCKDLQQSPYHGEGKGEHPTCLLTREGRSEESEVAGFTTRALPYGSDGWSHYSFECLLRLASERGASTAKVLIIPKTKRTNFGNLNESIPT